MALTDLRLSILAFPQRWDGVKISARVLLLPSGDPLAAAAGLPKFAGTSWKLRATILPGLDAFWAPGAANAAAAIHTSITFVPPNDVALFEALRDFFNIVPPQDKALRLSRLTNTRIKKALPESYTSAFPFERPSTPDALVGNEFGCAIREVIGGLENDPKPPNEMTWGKLIAFALRQPLLARALGFIYDFTPTLPDAAALKDGGWLFLALDPNAPGQPSPAKPDAIRSYAARLPALDGARELFAAVLFPLGQTNQAGYDAPLSEAARYDDGFAKVVHSFQPDTADAATSGHNRLRPATDAGIDLGWDDEQVLIWQNRQLENSMLRLGGPVAQIVEAPLGIGGYRVDVRTPELADTAWHSLCEAFSAGPDGAPANLRFPPAPAPVLFSKAFAGELTVEPAPVRNRHAADKVAWLPRYFTRWQGGSLVVSDDTLLRLTAGNSLDANGNPIAPPPNTYGASALPVKLRYGVRYEFRCRFADLTGGGPDVSRGPANPAPAPTTARRFLRHVPPKSLRIETDPPAPKIGEAPEQRTINAMALWRPLMGYPELIYAGIDDPQVVVDLIARVQQAKDESDAAGVNDPDVATVRISVQVRVPAHDSGPAGSRDGEFREVYAVTRVFPAFDHNAPLEPGTPLMIEFDYQDVPDVEAFVEALAVTPPAEDAPLPIPRERDVRLRLTPFCDDKHNYYASKEVRRGLTSDMALRAPAKNEDTLFAEQPPERELNAIFFQPGNNIAAVLAQRLHLDVAGLTFSAQPFEDKTRVVFGASGALRHTLSGDHGTITFAAESELRSHWIVALMLDLNRDWSWDGLKDRSFEISRFDQEGDPPRVIGEIDLRFATSKHALTGADKDFPDRRKATRLIFFDAVDPTPPNGKFPSILSPSWTITPQLRNLPGAAQARTLNVQLPVAVAPRQTPRIVSAGVALSPYENDETYSTTSPRRRALWVEFAEPVADEHDAYFARVLGYGPDSLLAGDISKFMGPWPEQFLDLVQKVLPNPPEPPPDLAVDPEPIRVIVPKQPEDFSGLDAMIEMIKAEDSDTHYLVPLPPGIAEDAAENFGFWTYEFRIGHKRIWSTARARFGRPQRVTGVQHPAPALACSVYRVNPAPGLTPPTEGIAVTAPYATAVFADRKLTNAHAGDPRTQLWVMLYAQVMQADGATHRNILLSRAPAKPHFDREDKEGGRRSTTRDVIGLAVFSRNSIEQVLADLALPLDSPLSVLTVEMLPGGGGGGRNPFAGTKLSASVDFFSQNGQSVITDPLGVDLGTDRSRRILRTSPLMPVPPAC